MMYSGSFKELTKVLNAYVLTVTLPLPDELVQVIQAYLDKHHPIEESDSQRLQDELLSIYQKEVKNHPNRYSVFIATLRLLTPAINGSTRIMQWWEVLMVPMLDYLAEEKGLVFEYRGLLLDILVYDIDGEKKSYDADASALLSDKLLQLWLKKTSVATSEAVPVAQYLEEEVKQVLIEFGKKRPKDFLTALDKFFTKKDYRAQILSLLCEFVRYGPPHLHQLLQTPLFDNLLRCLQIDTSTTVVSLALTAMTMFLPHIPNDIATQLPSLFNIYRRILFWDRKRSEHALYQDTQSDHTDLEKHMIQVGQTEDDPQWEKLFYTFELDREAVPELLHYFTFLYGLYPINFMSYIRKPERYLRHANFDGSDDVEVQPSEIRQRSEPLRQSHLLHPNFYTMTIESELTDLNRWMNSEASDVIAACMALFRPCHQGSNSQPGPPGSGGLLDTPETIIVDGDTSGQPLLGRNDEIVGHSRRVPSDVTNASWRNTMSTKVDTPDGSRRQSSAERKPSQATPLPIADSPTLGPLETQTESPNLPPQLLFDSHDKPEGTRMFQEGLQQSLHNESEISLVSSQHREPSIADSYLQSMEKHQGPRSPSLHPSPTEGDSTTTSLRRELMLMKNELNFERYLKQQHLSHIGQLRRKHVKQATAEADTQNLINSNKMLKNKLDEAKNSTIQMKKEAEKSRSQAKKWEDQLTAKLRVLREEQKKWNIETETLRRDLESSQASQTELRRMVVGREAEALASRQKVQSIEGNVDEIGRLRTEVEKLTGLLRTYEAREIEIERAKASEALALTRVEILEMRLRAQENELESAQLAADREVHAIRMELEETRLDLEDQVPPNFQLMLDNALAVSRLRLNEQQKAHDHLLMKFNKLHNQYLALKDHRSSDEPLLSGGGDDSYRDFGNSYSLGSSPPARRTIRRRGLSDPDLSERMSHSFSSPSEHSSGYFPIRPGRVDTTVSVPRPSSQEDFRFSSKGLQSSTSIGHIRSGSADSAQAHAGLNLTATGLSLDAAGKPKIKPSSDIRVYGRGGVQNVGSTPKAKKDKKKEDPDKKDKKGTGLRGIRGFA